MSGEPNPTLHLTELKCLNCYKKFYVQNGKAGGTQFCPFCGEESLNKILDIKTR